MSKVYKHSQIVLGEEKIVELNIKPIIKFNENKEVDLTETSEIVNESIDNPEDIIQSAIEEAERILENAKLEREEILENAERERETVISEAYTKSNEILESAKEEGYSKGFLQGKEDGLKETDSIIEEAKEIKQNVLLEKKAVAKSLESEIIDLIISGIRKVIDHEVERDHQLLLNLVRKGIEKCIYTDSLIIRVSSNDYEVVNSSKNKIYIMTEGIDHIEVKQDPALKDGSIIIETISGTVEASIQTQIAQIEQMFYDILKGE